jgi:hypothetical protein
MIRPRMRWLAVWLVLAGVFFAGQLVAPLFSGAGGSWEYTWEDLAHLVAIPLVQVAAVWIVVLVRRSASPPPPAPERSASRPDAEP